MTYRLLIIAFIMVFPLVLVADPHPHGDGAAPSAQAKTKDKSFALGLPDTPKVEGKRPWMDAFFCKRIPFNKIPLPFTSFRLPGIGVPDAPWGWHPCP